MVYAEQTLLDFGVLQVLFGKELLEEGSDEGEEDVNDAAETFLVDDVGLAYPLG